MVSLKQRKIHNRLSSGELAPLKLQQYQCLNYLLPLLHKRIRNPQRKYKEMLKLWTGLTVNSITHAL